MNCKSSNVNYYCSTIRDEEQCWSRFLHFGSSFVDVESNVRVALTEIISKACKSALIRQILPFLSHLSIIRIFSFIFFQTLLYAYKEKKNRK